MLYVEVHGEIGPSLSSLEWMEEWERKLKTLVPYSSQVDSRPVFIHT